MADSAALNAAVWNGAVPLCVSLDAHEVAATTAPAPLFALLPRHSYLPLLSAAAAEHFQDVLPPCADDAWFDAAGLPLKWTLPVGVLHDLLGGGQLPWRLSVHFRGFPDATLLRCAGAEAVRAHLFNTLKESSFLASGSASAVMTLPSSAQTDLWQGLVEQDYGRYQRGASVLQSALRATRRVSIRVHVRVNATAPAAWSDVLSSSHACELSSDAGALCLRDFLATLLPASRQDGATVRIQGVEPPLDAPLQTLHAHFRGPDGFVHLVVLLPARPAGT